jgi:tetratricopeptide (TPR) repeat protein
VITSVNRTLLIAGASLWLTLIALTAAAAQEDHPLAKRHWFEARTAHFHTYSCGPTQEVARLAARLEQFYEMYAALAGTQAVVSPPIVVMAFPDHAAMEPFLPLYQGKPANLAAFFSRHSDENLIVLSLSNSGGNSLQAVFHEYTHLLLRHNERFWPLWLKEGMAEIYSTFEATGNHSARIGRPLEKYVQFLEHEQFMPLEELFAVTHESADYNEGQRQGVFYAESWLLTHYLMLGDNPANKARFAQLTVLLRQGESPSRAFTRAFQTTLPAMRAQLRRYLERGRFESCQLVTKADLAAARAMTTRGLSPAETCFRLGDQLLRVNRLEDAAAFFHQAESLDPSSPLPQEGLGLLASEQHQPEEAVRRLREALQHGSKSFLAYYTCAREQLRLLASSPDAYTRLAPDVAAEIRGRLEKSLKLMPDFGPAHQLLGFLEMLQCENLASAEQHLRRAIQLEPENESYSLTLARAQLLHDDLDGARRTLQLLRLPYVDPGIRTRAGELLDEMAAVPRGAGQNSNH